MLMDAMLNANGICSTPDAFSPEDIAHVNATVDPLFAERAAQRRSYVHVDELQELGLLDIVLGKRMRDILFSVMPDPVLYHCLMVETAGNDPEPNLFAETLSGWHRDRDCSFSKHEPTHVSVFVYLSNVGERDGAFEFVPQNPNRRLYSSTPCALVQGEAGYTFVWQRSYYHRASPNSGPRRRRLFKISIQRNAFPSVHLGNDHFRRTIERLPSGDPALDLLFGRYQGKPAPQIARPADVPCAAIAATRRLGVADRSLVKAQLRINAALAKDRLRELVGGPPARVAYD
jgi:hypothetical protein